MGLSLPLCKQHIAHFSNPLFNDPFLVHWRFPGQWPLHRFLLDPLIFLFSGTILSLPIFFLFFTGGLQGDVVFLGWPIAPSYMSPNAGGGGRGELRGLSQRIQLYTGAQKNSGDLNPYLTYDSLSYHLEDRHSTWCDAAGLLLHPRPLPFIYPTTNQANFQVFHSFGIRVFFWSIGAALKGLSRDGFWL
jgi:hypothetical protein